LTQLLQKQNKMVHFCRTVYIVILWIFLQNPVALSYLFNCCRLHYTRFLTCCWWHAYSVHTAKIAEKADDRRSPMGLGAAGGRVTVSLTHWLYICVTYFHSTLVLFRMLLPFIYY